MSVVPLWRKDYDKHNQLASLYASNQIWLLWRRTDSKDPHTAITLILWENIYWCSTSKSLPECFLYTWGDLRSEYWAICAYLYFFCLFSAPTWYQASYFPMHSLQFLIQREEKREYWVVSKHSVLNNWITSNVIPKYL